MDNSNDPIKELLERTITVEDLDSGAEQLWRQGINILAKAKKVKTDDQVFHMHTHALQLRTSSLDEARVNFYRYPEDSQIQILWEEYWKTYREMMDFIGKYGTKKGEQ